MALFPDLAKDNFLEIQFFGHVGGAYREIKKYWSQNKKCTAEKVLGFYMFYGKKRHRHVALLNVRPAAKGCADFRVVLATNLLPQEAEDHIMSESEFLGMFKRVIQVFGEDAFGPVSFSFKRYVRSSGTFFRALPSRGYALEGFKLRAPDSAPIFQLSMERLSRGRVLVEVKSKPTFSIDKDALNEKFFLEPVQQMITLSDGFLRKVEQSNYAERKL